MLLMSRKYPLGVHRNVPLVAVAPGITSTTMRFSAATEASHVALLLARSSSIPPNDGIDDCSQYNA
jgi:hypothetical protein